MTEVNGVKYDENIFQLTSSRRGWRSIMLFIWYTSIFQLTSSRRGWPAQQTLDQLLRQFQLTSSRRGWHDGRCVKSCCSYFNSHPHEEDDVFSSPQVSFYKHFNSHPHEEDDILLEMNYIIIWRFQLTSSRRGWHGKYWKTFWILYISTHILTKRMTEAIMTKNRESRISTHILTKRMTGRSGRVRQEEEHFNSHPHEEDDFGMPKNSPRISYFNSHPHEEDDMVGQSYVLHNIISTHILTKRMTDSNVIIFCFTDYFNSHPHEEDDNTLICMITSVAIFQLTSSRRGWPVPITGSSWLRNFNSHPHEEDDSNFKQK